MYGRAGSRYQRDEAELFALLDAMDGVGAGVLELVPSGIGGDPGRGPGTMETELD